MLLLLTVSLYQCELSKILGGSIILSWRHVKTSNRQYGIGTIAYFRHLEFSWLLSVAGLWRKCVSRVIWYWASFGCWAEMAGTEVNKFLTVFYPLEHLYNLLHYFSENPWDFRTFTSILLSCVSCRSQETEKIIVFPRHCSFQNQF